MAITPRQAAARSANGKLSCGPTSAQGRAASSQNALKFGFFALNPLERGFYRSLHELQRLQAIRQYERQNDPTDFIENKRNATESATGSQDPGAARQVRKMCCE